MYFLYKIPGKPPSKRTTLVRAVGTNVYVDKISNFIAQYVSGTRWKPD